MGSIPPPKWVKNLKTVNDEAFGYLKRVIVNLFPVAVTLNESNSVTNKHRKDSKTVLESSISIDSKRIRGSTLFL